MKIHLIYGKKQSVKCQTALLNLNKKQPTLKEHNDLRCSLNHPILYEKNDKLKSCHNHSETTLR